jgi:DNA gyrase subunit A
MVHPEDEVFAITSAGGVIRTSAAEIKQSGRQTMGVRLVNLGEGQSLVAIARNAESLENGSLEADPDDENGVTAETGLAVPDRDENDTTGSADAESGNTE